jgi:hypothetical protein
LPSVFTRVESNCFAKGVLRRFRETRPAIFLHVEVGTRSKVFSTLRSGIVHLLLKPVYSRSEELKALWLVDYLESTLFRVVVSTWARCGSIVTFIIQYILSGLHLICLVHLASQSSLDGGTCFRRALCISRHGRNKDTVWLGRLKEGSYVGSGSGLVSFLLFH